MLLYYIRHGDPNYNPDSLTPFGHSQAEALSKRLAINGFDKIYTSTSARAFQTAEPTAKLLNKEIITLDWCNEKYVWEELTVKHSDRTKSWLYQDENYINLFNSNEVLKLGSNWLSHNEFLNTATETGIKRIKKESFNLLKELGYEHIENEGRYKIVRPNNERIALFAHQGFGLAFLSIILDIPYPLFCTHFDLSTSGVNIITFDNNKSGYTVAKMLQLSNDSHLYKENIDTTYNRNYKL